MGRLSQIDVSATHFLQTSLTVVKVLLLPGTDSFWSNRDTPTNISTLKTSKHWSRWFNFLKEFSSQGDLKLKLFFVLFFSTAFILIYFGLEEATMWS